MGRKTLEAVGAVPDKFGVVEPFGHNDVQEGVEQRDIGSPAETGARVWRGDRDRGRADQ